MDLSTFAAQRAALLEGGPEQLRGAAFGAAYSALVDELLRGLLHPRVDVALVAVGGYGRAELCPGSDVDVLLVHRGAPDVGALAERIWYPLWDAGLKVGHGVRTVKEALSLAASDLDTATSLLDARTVAGDSVIGTQLRASAVAQWQRRAGRWLDRLGRAVRERHIKAGEVAFLLEPDLKEGRGGLRDVHALRWAEAAQRPVPPGDRRLLADAYGTLLEVRVELHRHTGRATDILALQEQDSVALALDDVDADALLHRVASAARTIAWVSDEFWRGAATWHRGPRRLRRTGQHVAEDVLVRDGAVEIDAEAVDGALAVRAATAAAERGVRLGRATIELLADARFEAPDPWPDSMRNDFVALLATGRRAIGVLESLDQAGALLRILPEWGAVRAQPQRNAYHRFTVDRHLVEAAAEAAARADAVERPDLLLVGALLHDIGKGFVDPSDPSRRDHSVTGEEVVRTIAKRMNFVLRDVDVLGVLVRQHLLLADVATRRDLEDEATIQLVASTVGDVETLRLLHLLTEADSIATGPAAWGSWKAGLVGELVARTEQALSGAAASAAEAEPTDEQRKVLDRARDSGDITIESDGGLVTVATPDRPGVFSRVAGTLALHGLDVLDARAFSTDDGWAVESFTVGWSNGDGPRWDAVGDDLRRALAGRLSIEARMAERSKAYTFRRAPALPVEPRVTVHGDASEKATVVEVRAADRTGTLYRITRALADLELDIRSAKITTIGHEVVDAFYVVDATGSKLDADHAAEVERAVLAELSRA